MYYLLVIAAVILGQTFTAAFLSWRHQISNDLIVYPTAFKVYIQKNIGTFVVIITFTSLVLFVLSDWMDLSLTRAELIAKGKLTKVEAIQSKFKTYAAFYGIFAQWIASYFFKAGEKAIKDYGKQKGVDINNN